jgi:hypothetical protein
MKTCPHCAQPVPDSAAACTYCGRDVGAPAAGPQAGGETGRWPLAVTALAGLAVGIVVIVVLVRLTVGRQTPGPTSEPKAAASGGAGATRRLSIATLPPSAPKWSGQTKPRWASDGSRTIEFELAAEQEVPVWMNRVRPSLVVRCLSRETDVVVLMRSSASFEREAGKHTVQVGFDDGADTAQQWLESSDSQALFAPDGVALARQIAQARIMRFGFSPQNASPVVVDFDVRGFDALIGSVAKTCGWTP